MIHIRKNAPYRKGDGVKNDPALPQHYIYHQTEVNMDSTAEGTTPSFLQIVLYPKTDTCIRK
jgi:hypothetical protein